MDQDPGISDPPKEDSSQIEPPREVSSHTNDVDEALPKDKNVIPGEGDQRKSSRKQILTPKGRENSLKTSISFMKSCTKRMKKQIDIVTLLLSGNNVDLVNSEMNTIENTYSEFTESYARACEVFGQDEAEEDLAELHAEISGGHGFSVS